MSGTTPRKRRAGKLADGRMLAQNFFKNGKFTSEWTEHDAKTYFGMSKGTESVLKTGPADKTPVEWVLGSDGTILKKELGA